MFGLSADRLVHVVFLYPDGHRVWFNHTDRRQDARTFVWVTVPIADDDPRQSKPMRYDMALHAVKRWREELHLNARIALEANGAFIDDEPAAPTGTPVERENMQYRGVLIRPASCNRWCIRMSNNIETIYSEPGGTPESVYEKLTTVFPQLVKFAEPYVAPEPTVTPVQQQQQAVPQYRRRPGDIPR